MLKIFTMLADWLTWTIIGLPKTSKLGSAVHFFIEDSTKIIALLIVMIYLIALVRASMNLEKVREHLRGRSRWFGYGAGAVFGAVTPFCSCSSIPMFLGFTSVGIPTGVTLSFLITSPLLNEVAIVLLGSLLGWRFMIVYIISGLAAGMLGGLFFDTIGAEKHLQPLAQQMHKSGGPNPTGSSGTGLTLKERHLFAKHEAKTILFKIWKWVLIGVGAGAALHGYVPSSWISAHLGGGAWWSVPMAVLMGIPLYSNAAGMIPVIESLFAKGLPAGTALALMLSTVGASFPEFILLKQVLKMKLLVYLFCWFLAAFTIIGWITNLLF